MKTVLLLTMAALLAAAQARAQSSPAQSSPAQSSPAPSPSPSPAAVHVGAPKFMPEDISGLELKDLDGRPFRLSELRGRVYVLNLWATWCGPCRMEIPGINKLYGDYSSRGVEFVGLTTEDPETDGEKVREFAREMRIKYKLGWVGKETARAVTAWGPSRPGRFLLPQTVVVAADGQIVLHIRGYNPRVPEMIRDGVEKALGRAPSAPAAPAPGRR